MPELTMQIQGLNFKSAKTAGEDFRKLQLKPAMIGPAVAEAMKLSPTKGVRLAKGILISAKTAKGAEVAGGHMIQWAREAGSPERQTVAKAFHRANASVALVHGISEMTRPHARAFMTDFFVAGGDLKQVAEWLSIAGGERRRNVRGRGGRGEVGGGKGRRCCG